MTRAAIPFLAVRPSEIAWILEANSESFLGKTTGGFQSATRTGSRWRAMLTFANLSAADAALLDAFMASLDGCSGRFYLQPLHREGVTTPIPAGKVRESGQTGNALNVTGYTAGQVFPKGAFFQVGSELKMLTAAATADASGNASLAFTPQLRSSPAHWTAVIGTAPVALMALDLEEYMLTRAGGTNAHESFTIPCYEVF